VLYLIVFVISSRCQVLLTNPGVRFCCPIQVSGFVGPSSCQVLLSYPGVRFCCPIQVSGVVSYRCQVLLSNPGARFCCLIQVSGFCCLIQVTSVVSPRCQVLCHTGVKCCVTQVSSVVSPRCHVLCPQVSSVVSSRCQVLCVIQVSSVVSPRCQVLCRPGFRFCCLIQLSGFVDSSRFQVLFSHPAVRFSSKIKLILLVNLSFLRSHRSMVSFLCRQTVTLSISVYN